MAKILNNNQAIEVEQRSSKTRKTTSNVVVKTAKATVNGKSETILTDTNGRTLYYFTSDTLHTVACTSASGASV